MYDREVARRVAVLASGCWEWQGTRNKKGYGQISEGYRSVIAHRWVWKRLRGSLDKTLTLDHLCRNRACVNPGHLEEVPVGVNVLRGNGISAENARKTECLRGHPLSGSNLYINPDGCRQCKACAKVRQWVRRGTNKITVC